MKITVTLTKKETEATKDIVREFGVEEKYLQIADQELEFACGPMRMKGKDNSYEFSIGEDFSVWLAEKFKKIAGLVKGIFKVFMEMSDDSDRFFDDMEDDIALINGMEVDAYLNELDNPERHDTTDIETFEV